MSGENQRLRAEKAEAEVSRLRAVIEKLHDYRFPQCREDLAKAEAARDALEAKVKQLRAALDWHRQDDLASFARNPWLVGTWRKGEHTR